MRIYQTLRRVDGGAIEAIYPFLYSGKSFNDLWFSLKHLVLTVHNLLIRPIRLILKVDEIGTRVKYMAISGNHVGLERY